MKEVWIPVPKVENKYLISNKGRIKTLGRYSCSTYSKRWINQAIKNQNTDRDGYKYVNLSLGYEKMCKRVHRLVAQAFIKNPENKPCINHKNGIKHDNRVTNLEWATYSENNTHAFRVLKRVHPKGMLGKTFKSRLKGTKWSKERRLAQKKRKKNNV